MKNRFFTPQLSDPIELRGEEFHHAVRVARARVGELVECFDGAGRNVNARVTSIERDSAQLAIVGEAPSREPATLLTLALALIQPEKFELVLQKGCELGVSSFVPLITERIEVRPERVAGKQERWAKILLEAVKQSGRSRIPELHPPTGMLEVLGQKKQMIVLDLDEEPDSTPLDPEKGVLIFVGPEGGFSSSELQSARASGATFRRLGPRRLRAETAAIAAAALFSSELVRR